MNRPLGDSITSEDLIKIMKNQYILPKLGSFGTIVKLLFIGYLRKPILIFKHTLSPYLKNNNYFLIKLEEIRKVVKKTLEIVQKKLEKVKTD